MILDDSVLEQARHCPYTRGALLALGAQLPADDVLLAALLEKAIARRDETVFTHLFMAAVGAKRHVDARHLVNGSVLFIDPAPLGLAAYHLQGDVGSALVEAVRSGRLTTEREGVALAAAAVWGQRQTPPTVTPGLIAFSRLRARRERHNFLLQQTLMTVAEVTGDEALQSVLADVNGAFAPAAARQFLAAFFEPVAASPLAGIPERADHAIIEGVTMRRAVDRIGRNDPCPCGSGKKYKKCCLEKDLERLGHSSEVAGLTQDELRANAETHLTAARIDVMRSHQVAALDPLKVPAPLQGSVLSRLCVFEEYEAATLFLEKVGYRLDLDRQWDDLLSGAVRGGRKDIVRRLLALQPDDESLETSDFDVRLLLEDNAGARLDLINQEVLKALRAGGQVETQMLVEIAYALVEGPYAPLGIAFARGVIHDAGHLDACMLVQALLEARDLLELSPEDPVDDWWEEQVRSELNTNPSSSAELEAVHERLEEKVAEIQRLKQSLAKTHQEVARRESTPSGVAPAGERIQASPAPVSSSSTPAAASPAEDPSLRDLRQKVEGLRSALKERHTERNQLRRELQETRATLETLRESQNAEQFEAGKESAEEVEDKLLAAEDGPIGTQPVRVVEFPRKFHEHLRSFPKPVARAAVVLAARLAAGEPPAFQGTKRLRLNREIFRQRVGADHRLLFRLHADTLEVVDVINRRDLERRIKTLT